jgi:hypothetical protein
MRLVKRIAHFDWRHYVASFGFVVLFILFVMGTGLRCWKAKYRAHRSGVEGCSEVVSMLKPGLTLGGKVHKKEG